MSSPSIDYVTNAGYLNGLRNCDRLKLSTWCQPTRHVQTRWRVVRNGYGKLRTKSKSAQSKDISEWSHPWDRGGSLSNAMSPSTRRRRPLAWSYGEIDSSPWTPVCTFTSVLTNTSSLAREPRDNMEGARPVADTGGPDKSEHPYYKVGILERTRNL